MSRVLKSLAVPLLSVAATLLLSTGSQLGAAEPQLTGEQTAGMAVFKENCARCHGWDGKGAYGGEDIFIEGVSLVDSTIDEPSMLETVTCGRPGTGMPRHLRDAWTPDHKCYGLVDADVPKDERAIQPIKRFLNETEIKNVVAFVRGYYQGKQPTYDTCVFYNGPSRICDALKK